MADDFCNLLIKEPSPKCCINKFNCFFEKKFTLELIFIGNLKKEPKDFLKLRPILFSHFFIAQLNCTDFRTFNLFI